MAVATSSALAAFFSRECAQAYEPQPFRESQFVLSSAIHAIKYVRKQFTTASGYPLIYFVDLTGADCFVCPPFKKTAVDGEGLEGIIDIDSSEPLYFNWKEFLARGLEPDELNEALSSPVYRVTIEHTQPAPAANDWHVRAGGEDFVTGTDGGCPDAVDWELRFWRQDQKVVRCTVSLDEKPGKYTIEGFGVNSSPAPGPSQGGQLGGHGDWRLWRQLGPGSAARRTWRLAVWRTTRSLFGGMEDDAFISYLRRRVQDRAGFNIKIGVVPYEHCLPERVKVLSEMLRVLLPSDIQADAAPTQPALAASEGTQDALAAGELAQPALALNEGTQDALAAGEPAQPALAAIEGFQDAPAAGVPTQPAPAADEPSQWHGDDTVGNRDTGTGVRWGTQSYGEINWGSWSGGGWGRDGWSSDTGQTRHDDSQGRQGSTSHSGRWTRKEWDEWRVRVVGWLG